VSTGERNQCQRICLHGTPVGPSWSGQRDALAPSLQRILSLGVWKHEAHSRGRSSLLPAATHGTTRPDAIGYVVHSPYEAVHWGEERAARGERALYVDAAWEYFSVNPVLSRERLHHSPFNRVYWNTQKSGSPSRMRLGRSWSRSFALLSGSRRRLSPTRSKLRQNYPKERCVA
jgi:hypothetical protein